VDALAYTLNSGCLAKGFFAGGDLDAHVDLVRATLRQVGLKSIAALDDTAFVVYLLPTLAMGTALNEARAKELNLSVAFTAERVTLVTYWPSVGVLQRVYASWATDAARGKSAAAGGRKTESRPAADRRSAA